MEGKLLLISSGVEEILTFEEVFNRYQNLINTAIEPWINKFHKEDLYQIASMGLWKAYKKYDINSYKVAFGYYAALVINGFLKVHYRDYKRNNNETVSLNDITPTESESTEYIDILQDNYSLENEICCRAGLSEAIKSLKEKERLFLILSLSGVEQKDIAKRYNTLQPSVSRVIKRAKNKIMDAMH